MVWGPCAMEPCEHTRLGEQRHLPHLSGKADILIEVFRIDLHRGEAHITKITEFAYLSVCNDYVIYQTNA